MKRLFLFLKHQQNQREIEDENGKILLINEDEDFSDLLEKASRLLNVKIIKIYLNLSNTKYIEITETAQLQNNDQIYGHCDTECLNLNEINVLNDWINLNIGGKCFTTTRSTLTTREPDSMLARMFNTASINYWKHKCSPNGAILIDRSFNYFEPIINYLRHGKLIIDANLNVHGLLEEAKFYAMDNLIELVEKEIQLREEQQKLLKNPPMSRRDIMQVLMQTKNETYLRFQSINLQGADLSRLDLSWINFKYANLSGANLNGSNISYSCFERADLSKANLENAKCFGVRMTCVNLESAVLTNADFEDPNGTNRHAILEGANLKSVCATACNMTGINLRVATLKNANLNNSILRNANLAGCDLENCNLNGCDLTEANLRGANFVGTTFDSIYNALHMSQVGIIRS